MQSGYQYTGCYRISAEYWTKVGLISLTLTFKFITFCALFQPLGYTSAMQILICWASAVSAVAYLTVLTSAQLSKQRDWRVGGFYFKICSRLFNEYPFGATAQRITLFGAMEGQRRVIGHRRRWSCYARVRVAVAGWLSLFCIAFTDITISIKLYYSIHAITSEWD